LIRTRLNNYNKLYRRSANRACLATLEENIKAGRLLFSTQASDAVAHAELIFIAVGTPADEDGSADLEPRAQRGAANRLVTWRPIAR
jgi:UDP-glucose 6-dehydrogenase